jgi:hypothetical protein
MSVLNWATLAGDGYGNYLLERNPFKGLPVPVEKVPVRAIVSGEEYASLLAAARKLDWRHEALLMLAHETGHRIGAIRQLRWSDIDMGRGLVDWPQKHRQDRDASHQRRSHPLRSRHWRRPAAAQPRLGTASFSPHCATPATPWARSTLRRCGTPCSSPQASPTAGAWASMLFAGSSQQTSRTLPCETSWSLAAGVVLRQSFAVTKLRPPQSASLEILQSRVS